MYRLRAARRKFIGFDVDREEVFGVSISVLKYICCLILGLGLVSQTGCGQRSSYQVSGNVHYKDGSPITGGTCVIRFEPTQSSTATLKKTATGIIAQDGSFQMFTRKPGDGVIPGKYAVTFLVKDKPMGGKMLIPEKYVSATETPFEITVDGNKTDLLYELDKQ
jgi:hypothetical protein